MEVTKGANIGSYIGVPIILDDGSMFGTLCAVDPEPHHFSRSNVAVLQSFSKFIANAIDVEKVYKENLTKEAKLKDDLELAKKVQRSVLSKPIHKSSILIDAFYKPSEALSGDMYCLFEIKTGKYGVIICDVMGHGVAASLISMSIRSILNSLKAELDEPEEVIQLLNSQVVNLFNLNDSITTYLTAIYVVIDTNRKKIEYVNAGHPPGVLVKDKKELIHLKKGSLPIGIFDDLTITKEVIEYEETTEIFMYTDGLIDLIDMTILKGVDYFGKLMVEPKRQPLFTFMESKFSGLEEQSDDVCFITIEVE